MKYWTNDADVGVGGASLCIHTRAMAKTVQDEVNCCNLYDICRPPSPPGGAALSDVHLFAFSTVNTDHGKYGAVASDVQYRYLCLHRCMVGMVFSPPA